MQPASSQPGLCNRQLFRLCQTLSRRIRSCLRQTPKPILIIRRFRLMFPCLRARPRSEKKPLPKMRSEQLRFASFNVAMFTLAPAIVSNPDRSPLLLEDHDEHNNQIKINIVPKGILKHSPLHQPLIPNSTRSKTKVSINLPDNEIALAHQIRSPVCFPPGIFSYITTAVGDGNGDHETRCRSIEEVLREVNADVVALQDVKAEEENSMKPLSDLAKSLGMEFVFAESWAPQYGNAILSRYPIIRWKVQKICDDRDFRNVLRATIEVPFIGEVNFHCTQLDHLDERWRMKQINAMFQSSNGTPHILAGGLNSLDGSDYSMLRWNNIVKYYEEIGKPTPKSEVIRLLKAKGYIDAKDFAGECEPIVMVSKGQNVQGTCKYGTRVDYIMASPDFPYKFVPKTYSVVSSKGTSDHHMVKVDMVRIREDRRNNGEKRKIIKRTSFNR